MTSPDNYLTGRRMISGGINHRFNVAKTGINGNISTTA
jgi:hypothetical protein